MKKIDLHKKLRGYRITYRHKHELTKDLSHGAFRLLELIIDAHDWDIKHHTHGYLNLSDKDISDYFGISRTTAWRWKRELINHKFIKVEPLDWIKVPHCYIYDSKDGPKVYKDLKAHDISNVQQEISILNSVISMVEEAGGIKALDKKKTDSKAYKSPYKGNKYKEDIDIEDITLGDINE